MASVWCATFGDRLKNFPRKRDALTYLRALTSDERIRPVVVRRCAGAYTFYGPVGMYGVLKAEISNVGFVSLGSRSRR